MWIIIDKATGLVAGTQKERDPSSLWNLVRFDVKEWEGDEPEIDSPDPTIDNPDWLEFASARVDFDAFVTQANNEIDWLDASIPLVDSANLAQLRVFLRRVMQQQREELKAWKYIFKRM